MKTINLLVSFILIATVATAQYNISVIQLAKAPNAKLIGQSNFGKVYALPLDNMPCIVPPTATAAVMPVAKTPLFKPAIPNAMREQDLIAVNTAPNNIFKQDKIAQQAPSKNLMLDLIRKK